MAAANPSKKRRLEQTSNVDSINKIAQRLSQMSSPLSFKRPRSCSASRELVCVQDMNLDPIEVTPEENTPFKLLGDHILQASPQQWLTNADNKHEMMQIQAWPNVACGNNFQVSHPFLASLYGSGQVFGPGC